MKKVYHSSTRVFAGGLFLLFFTLTLDAKVFITNENVIDKRAVERIETIGKELKEKTGITTHIVALQSLGKTPLITYEQNLSKSFPKPYILLSIVIKEHQVDIQASKDVLDKFDREGVLSPYPWSGTILPILASKDGEDKASAAILNGYGDIADQVAESSGIVLETSIGNANKNVINIIKVIFYSFCVITISMIIYFRRKKKRERI